MPQLHGSLVLASASPRRRAILETLGLPFLVEASGVEELRVAGEPAIDYARRLAAAKAADVATRFSDGTIVLGADTVVVVDGDVLEKASSSDEAAAMIARLAGRRHEVVTAMALVRRPEGLIGALHVSTAVTFRALDAAAITRYVASGDGDGKAGAYAVQGLGAGLVTQIEGSYLNVVGLPAAELLDLLASVGVLTEWP